jgi:hypothetical protein
MLWGGQVFHRTNWAFLFIAFGTIGSVFFHTLRFSIRNALATLLFVSLIISVLVLRSHKIYSIRDILVTIASASSMYIYFTAIYNQPKRRMYTEPLVLAALFAISNFFAFLMFALLEGLVRNFSGLWVYGIFKQWFLIGLGIGIGIILTEQPVSEKLRTGLLNFIQGNKEKDEISED